MALASLREAPWWARNISPSWKPTVSTGFREESASWKIIAIFWPRIFRRSSLPMVSMSWPRKRISPCGMRAGGMSRMPMIACAVTDFPEPDSPRTASVSPALTL